MENFLTYKRWRWMRVHVLLMLVCISLYVLDEPLGGRSGSSWLGWTYGVFSALGILYLMWFGARKRSYHSASGTLQGWLSAHVWLGVSLALLVPLHSGFQFGLNVHTLAYGLMLIVIISGVYGAIRYVTLAPKIQAHRGGGGTKKLLEAIQQQTADVEKMLQGKSDLFVKLREAADFNFAPSIWVARKRSLVPARQTSLEAEYMSKLSDAEQSDAHSMLALIAKKRQLALQLQEDVRTVSLLQVWLYVHVPLSFALLVAVLLHIFVVYWYR
jgi:hypothetical protein